MVRSTLVTAWRLATSPTSTSPFLANATTDGVVRAPSAFAMTVGSPPSRTDTTELVVPRAIPTARSMLFLPVASRPVGPDVRGLSADACRESGKQVEPDQLNFLSTGQRSGPAGLFPGQEGLFGVGGAVRR